MIRRLWKNEEFVGHIGAIRVLGRIDDYLLIEGECEDGGSHYVINDRKIPAIHEGVVEVDQETFYLALANLAEYKFLLEQESYEECGEVYESFNDLVEMIYEQAFDDKLVDLGEIEFIHEMVNALKDHEVDEEQFQEVITGLCDIFIRNMLASDGAKEFMEFPASKVHDQFMKIYKVQEIGENHLADQFATDCVLYICHKLSKHEGQVQ